MDSADTSPRPKAAEHEKLLYNQKADYTRPVLELSPEHSRDLREHLRLLYGEKQADEWLPELERVIKVHHAHKPEALLAHESSHSQDDLFSQRDMILITYGDMIKADGGKPLQVLARVCHEHIKAPNTLHILPFFPYSSDRGFSVIDFRRVDPKLGDWSDIRSMAGSFKLMFDGVLNHISSRSQAFEAFMDGDPRYGNFFIAYNSPDELTPDQRSKIFRPRTSDILTEFPTINGLKYVWTTFSEDQIDLNYRDPEVLIYVIECLLFYVRHGANILRLDAVTYIWAEPGTECVNLPETHEVVKLLHTVMEAAAPGVALLTETNVDHKDNVAYFGNGHDEAHLVYNFALPPLVLHTLYTGQAETLTNWVRDLMTTPSDQTNFFNILDTHDGIGLMGVKNILSQEQIDHLIAKAKENGAMISFKTVEGGGREPYEINSTWWSALNASDSDEDMELQARRLAASRSIALALRGVPGVYIHGMLGTENDLDTFHKTGHARDVNRAPIYIHELEREAQDLDSKLAHIVRFMVPLNLARVREKAFHPRGSQKVLSVSRRAFILLRSSPQGDEHILALTNVSDQEVLLKIGTSELEVEASGWRDVANGHVLKTGADGLEVELGPYQVAWLKAERLTA